MTRLRRPPGPPRRRRPPGCRTHRPADPSPSPMPVHRRPAPGPGSGRGRHAATGDPRAVDDPRAVGGLPGPTLGPHRAALVRAGPHRRDRSSGAPPGHHPGDPATSHHPRDRRNGTDGRRRPSDRPEQDGCPGPAGHRAGHRATTPPTDPDSRRGCRAGEHAHSGRRRDRCRRDATNRSRRATPGCRTDRGPSLAARRTRVSHRRGAPRHPDAAGLPARSDRLRKTGRREMGRRRGMGAHHAVADQAGMTTRPGIGRYRMVERPDIRGCRRNDCRRNDCHGNGARPARPGRPGRVGSPGSPGSPGTAGSPGRRDSGPPGTGDSSGHRRCAGSPTGVRSRRNDRHRSEMGGLRRGSVPRRCAGRRPISRRAHVRPATGRRGPGRHAIGSRPGGRRVRARRLGTTGSAGRHGRRPDVARRCVGGTRPRTSALGPDRSHRADPPTLHRRSAWTRDPTGRHPTGDPAASHARRRTHATSNHRHPNCCPDPNRTDRPLPYLPAYGGRAAPTPDGRGPAQKNEGGDLPGQTTWVIPG